MKFFDDCETKKEAQERYYHLKIIFKSHPEYLNVVNRDFYSFRETGPSNKKIDKESLWKRMKNGLRKFCQLGNNAK